MQSAVTMAALLVLAAIAGCGGSDEPAPVPDPQATAAYIAKVDPLCKAYAHRLQISSQDFEAAQHRAGATGQDAAVAERYRTIAAQLERFADRVEAFDPPPADADAIDAWLGAEREQAAAQRALADALAHSAADEAALEAAQARVAGAVDAGRSAIADLGFRYCE